jgi:hypothetical protein
MSNIKNETDRETRLVFMRIDGGTVALLREVWPVVENALPAILDGFYAHVTKTPALATLIGEQTPRLKKAQARIGSGCSTAASITATSKASGPSD